MSRPAAFLLFGSQIRDSVADSISGRRDRGIYEGFTVMAVGVYTLARGQQNCFLKYSAQRPSLFYDTLHV